MTTVRRDESAEKSNLTTGEKLMLLILIAWGMVGLFVLLAAIGMIR